MPNALNTWAIRARHCCPIYLNIVSGDTDIQVKLTFEMLLCAGNSVHFQFTVRYFPECIITYTFMFVSVKHRYIMQVMKSHIPMRRVHKLSHNADVFVTVLIHKTSMNYRQVSNIRRTLIGNKIVDNSDIVGASPVGAAPTASSLST